MLIKGPILLKQNSPELRLKIATTVTLVGHLKFAFFWDFGSLHDFFHFFFFHFHEIRVQNQHLKRLCVNDKCKKHPHNWDVAKTILFFSHNLELTFLQYIIQVNWNFFNYLLYYSCCDRTEQVLSIDLIPRIKYKLTKQMKNGPKTWIQDCGKKVK
jgi:hypothetical protein